MKALVTSVIMAAAAVVPTPALAADAFPSFDGTNGSGGFYYGYTDGLTATAFTQTNGDCAINGSTCLHSTFANLPQASVGGTFPTVSVPTNAILLHPGNSASQAVYSAYLASAAGNYGYTINLQSVGIDTTNGIGYTPFTMIAGVITQGTRTVLSSYNSTATLSGIQTLAAGDSFGVIIDYNGDYSGDSTGLNFAIAAVPEPATWGMMLAGFGMVGFSLRSRRRRSVTVKYA